MDGKLCELLEEASQRSGDILRKVLHRARPISDDVVRRFLLLSVELCFTKGRKESVRILGRVGGNMVQEGKER